MNRLVPQTLVVRLEAKDAVAIIQALHQRMASLPTEGENEYGSWVEWGRMCWLSGKLTAVLSQTLAASLKPAGIPAYWRAVNRAEALIRRFVWPFKRGGSPAACATRCA